MRFAPALVVMLCLGCDEPPASNNAPEGASAPDPQAARPTPASGTPQPTDEATTTGFIEAKVNGELKRYEYLPASENRVLRRLTVMKAQRSADDEEGFEFVLMSIDVRQLEMPAVIRSAAREARAGNLRAAMRMPAIKYRDASGNRYIRVVQDESLRCESLEDLVLTCTFSGTLRGDNGAVEISDGRLQVKLGTDARVDAITEAIGGRASDEAVDFAQEQIDRRLGKMR